MLWVGVACRFVHAQPSASMTVRGAVLGRADGAAIVLAQLRTTRGTARAQTDVNGAFAMAVDVKDTLIVRALGFREQRIVVRDAMLRNGPLPITGIRNTTLRIELDALPTVLPALITSIGQRVIRANDVPNSVTVVDERAIASAAAVSVNQVLRQIPGLQELPSPPSKTSIAIRGFDNSRVLVLVDGEPVAGALVESRDIGRLSSLAVERIEVTKGPASVEFGSDALGGVINVVTAAPSERLTIDGLARSGELGRHEASGGISQRVGRFGYRLSGDWRQSDRVTGYDAAGTTLDRVYDLRADLRYTLGDRWALRFDAQGSQERQRFPLDAQFNGFIDDRGGQGFAELSGALLGGSARARAFVQRFDYEYRQSRELLPIHGSADSVRQHERQERYLLAYSRAVGAHTVDIGFQRSERALVAPTKVDGDSARDHVTEVYARDQWTLGTVLVTAGARHTTSALWGESTNPSVGASWQTTPSVRLRANVARGFRAPSFKEIRYTFFNPAGGYVLIGNATLKPESSVSSTIGASWAPSRELAVDVEAFRNDVDGLIDWHFQGNNAAGYQLYANVNVARARTQGFDATVRSRWHSADLSVSYEYLHARDLGTSLPLSRRAAHTARVALQRTWAVRNGLTADASARYTGRAPLIGIPSGAPIVGEFSTASGIIGQQGALLSIDAQLRLLVTSASELSAGVNNALNQQPALWTPAFARQVYVGLRVHWAN